MLRCLCFFNIYRADLCLFLPADRIASVMLSTDPGSLAAATHFLSRYCAFARITMLPELCFTTMCSILYIFKFSTISYQEPVYFVVFQLA